MKVDLSRQRISVEDWSRRVEWVRPGTEPGSWRAKLGLHGSAALLVEWEDNPEREIAVSLWTSEPEHSPGAAVLVGGDAVNGIARVPVCECGEQGCADASWQFSESVPASYLPRLVDALQGLPVSPTITDYARVWRGEWWYFAAVE